MNTGIKRTSLIVACSVALCALPGALSAQAADKTAQDAADKHFKQMDSDGDGKISRTEHAAGAKKMFADCDSNKDGTVTAVEMDASMVTQGYKPAADDKTSAEKIQMLDQNADGKLTATEHEAGAEKMFGKMDTNSDGFLSKEECDAGQKLLKKDK
jgi:Ca2+-binding EF-hand superfamily protein